jgi:hypothetical protein
MELPYNVYAICPLCGFENKLFPHHMSTGLNLVTCDLEEGGCDKIFAVEATPTVNLKVYKMELVESNDEQRSS